MNPDTLRKLERLAEARIDIVPLIDVTSHFVLAREQWAAFVERSGDGFGQIGSAGRLTDRGLAVLVWRQETAYFQGKGWEEQASADDVAQLRAFASDLEQALAG